MRPLSTLALLAALGVLAPASARAATRQERLDWIAQGLETSIKSFQSTLTHPNPTPVLRDLTTGAYYMLALGQDSAAAQALLQKAFDQQDMNPDSPTYGNVLWQMGHPEIKDANAIEFTVNPLGPMFLLHGAALSAEFKAAAVPHLRAALAAVRRHRVGIDYTNIYLMKSCNIHLLGLILHDPVAADDGAKMLRDWFAFTRTHGITEFDSPTYFSTQLGCLLQAYRATTDQTLKPQLKAALDYLWTDLAANTFLPKPGGAQLAGPFSRNYDFYAGSGPLDRYMYVEGLRTAIPTHTLFVDMGSALMNDLEHGYRPDPAILALAKIPERLIQQRAGILLGQDRTCYITPSFAIGSTSCYHGPQDRELSISLAGTDDQPLADISVVPDSFDAPYGVRRLKDRSGHPKATHVRDALAAVQEKGAVLALMNLVPGLDDGPQTSVATNILFPANADEILLDGQPLTLAADQALPVSAESWLVIREGHAAAALRIFAADPPATNGAAGAMGGGEAGRWFIKYDGTDLHAARLVAYHYQGAPRMLKDKIVRAGVILLARACETPADAHNWFDQLRKMTITQNMAGNAWSATLDMAGGGPVLSATLDLAHRGPLHRTVDGKEMAPAGTLTVNGKEEAGLLPGGVEGGGEGG